MNTDIKKTVRLSFLLSLSIALSIIENYISIFNIFIPGLKLGLANIVLLYILIKYTFKDAIYVSILRVFVIGLLLTGLFNITFFFSLSGALFSILFMYLFKKLKFSTIGISIVGSLSHNIGQIIIAVLFLNNIKILYYLPYLLILSIPTGIIVGIVSKELLKIDL